MMMMMMIRWVPLFAMVVLGSASEEMALRILFHRGGKLRSTEGKTCTVDERNHFLGAIRFALLETYHHPNNNNNNNNNNNAADDDTPWWCHGLCQQHHMGEYCVVVHPHCPLLPKISYEAASTTRRRQLHENRMLPVRELDRQAHPSELRRDRSTSDQKLMCRGTKVSFLSRVRAYLDTNHRMISDDCLFFLKHRFEMECFAVPAMGVETFQLSSIAPPEVGTDMTATTDDKP